MNNESSQQTYKSAQEMIALLLRKGYDGEFMFQSDDPPMFTTGTVEHCLNKFLLECELSRTSLAHCKLTTDFYNDDRSPPWFCRIMLEYKLNLGLKINNLNLYKMGMTQAEEVKILSNDDLPNYKKLGTMSSPQPKWKMQFRHMLSKIKIRH